MEVSSTNRSARATQVQTQLAEKQKPQDKKVESGATEPNAKRDAAKSARSEQATQSLAKVAEKQRVQEQERTAKAAEQAAKREAPQSTINSQGQRIGQVINTTA